MDIETKAYHKIIFKVKLNTDINTSPSFLQRQHWIFRGKGCFVVVWSLSCLTLCHPMDCSPPGSSIDGIFQARILVWVAIFFSKGSSQPRYQNFAALEKNHTTCWGSRTQYKGKDGKVCYTVHAYLINDYIKTKARQLITMDSPHDVLPGLKDDSPIVEFLHHHHTYLSVMSENRAGWIIKQWCLESSHSSA